MLQITKLLEEGEAGCSRGALHIWILLALFGQLLANYRWSTPYDKSSYSLNSRKKTPSKNHSRVAGRHRCARPCALPCSSSTAKSRTFIEIHGIAKQKNLWLPDLCPVQDTCLRQKKHFSRYSWNHQSKQLKAWWRPRCCLKMRCQLGRPKNCPEAQGSFFTCRHSQQLNHVLHLHVSCFPFLFMPLQL